MQQHAPTVDVQEKACSALSNLAAHTVDNEMRIAAGGIERIVAAMKQHVSVVGLQRWACSALGDLANIDNKMRIPSADGLVCFLSAMEQHACAGDVQHSACHALANLAGGDVETNSRIVTAGGIERILCAMNSMRRRLLCSNRRVER